MFSAAQRKSLATALAGAALASALVVSGAYAHYGYQDLRSPDAVDAARQRGGPAGRGATAVLDRGACRSGVRRPALGRPGCQGLPGPAFARHPRPGGRLPAYG
jgi:hypothetical protein